MLKRRRSRLWQRRLPGGLSFAGGIHPAAEASFLSDTTWVDEAGLRHCDQQIFSNAFDMIRKASRLVLLDMFLYNDFPMKVAGPMRPLSHEMTDALLRQKLAHPEIAIIVITDPINTVYGSVPSAEFEVLANAGIPVVITDLARLRDSNPLYTLLWRLCIRPLGNSGRGWLPNPFCDNAKITLRSFLEMLNFKANHRKLLLSDDGGQLAGLVTSANPHDASSAHTNVALRFTGPAATDLLRSENTVLQLCGLAPLDGAHTLHTAASDTSIQVLTEYAIKATALRIIGSAKQGDRIDLAAFYLSDRDVVGALKKARRNGALLRVLLDPNHDAFGHNKFGIPNRPVAAELRRADIEVRWIQTHGEQCHAKMLLGTDEAGDGQLLLGSANLTRRNLDNFNLETNVLVYGPRSSRVIGDARKLFNLLWNNRPAATFSVPYEHYRDESPFKKILYRFMEASGLCTF